MQFKALEYKKHLLTLYTLQPIKSG